MRLSTSQSWKNGVVIGRQYAKSAVDTAQKAFAGNCWSLDTFFSVSIEFLPA